MDLVWRQRSRLYLVGMGLFLVAILAYVAGFVAPYWITVDLDNPGPLHIYSGLWFSCNDDGDCEELDFDESNDAKKAVRILQALGLLALVVSVFIALFSNCRRNHPGTSFALEAVIALGAALGFAGAMVYVSETREDVEDDMGGLLPPLDYGWAFALSVAACLLALLSSILILIANILEYRRSLPASTTKDSDVPPDNTNAEPPPPTTVTQPQTFDNPVYYKEWEGTRGVSGRDRAQRPLPTQDYQADPSVYLNPVSHPQQLLYYMPTEQNPPHPQRDERRLQMVRMKAPPPQQAYYYYDQQQQQQRAVVGRDPHQQQQQQAPFAFPRAHVRGFYEPGYGHPEYFMY